MLDLVSQHEHTLRRYIEQQPTRVPEGLSYADIKSPGYNGWINLLWGPDKFPVGMVPPPYATQIKRAIRESEGGE